MKEKIVFEFSKNTHENVQVVLKTWNGRDLLDLRVYYVDPETNQAKPSKKGLCLSLDQFEDLKSAIFALEKEIKKGCQPHAAA